MCSCLGLLVGLVRKGLGLIGELVLLGSLGRL